MKQVLEENYKKSTSNILLSNFLTQLIIKGYIFCPISNSLLKYS